MPIVKLNENESAEENGVRSLDDLSFEDRQRALSDRNFVLSNFPQLIDRSFIPPKKIKVLIVTDAGGDYGTGTYGLELVVKALLEHPSPFLTFFPIIQRHRTLPVGDNPKLDKFTDAVLEGVDELWMFGIDLGITSSLDAEELKVISEFMDKGMGVFAVGDHETLGAPLCGAVPRVRSMRKWFKSSPSQTSALRHDSLRKGTDGYYLNSDQEDHIPQEIFPIMYTALEPGSFEAYPHSLLSRQDQVIKYFPDHMHEGQCCVPEDLTTLIEYTGSPEYPQGSGSIRISPQIVAKAVLTEPHFTSAILAFKPNPMTQVNSFNLVGAYDGHQVSALKDEKPYEVGRVVVDSSFHHFIYINLAGFLGDGVPEQAKRALEDFKTYYRNIGLWLAPQAVQRAMRNRALWMARWSHPLVEEITGLPPHTFDELEQLDAQEVTRLGVYARAFVTQLSSEPVALQWAIQSIRDVPPSGLPGKDGFLYSCDPWMTRPADEQIEGHSIKAVANAILGGAVVALAAKFKEDENGQIDLDESEMNKAVAEGARVGFLNFQKILIQKMELLAQQVRELNVFLNPEA